MLKKLIKMSICNMMLIVLVLSIMLPVAAQSIEPAENSLFVATPAVPNDVITYAKSDFCFHLMSMVESGDFTGDPYQVELGTPFTYLADDEAVTQYYFPVIYNGNIVYIYRVYEDVVYYRETGELRYASSMSNVLVDALLELSEQTSNDNPAIFTVNNNNILATVGSEVSVIAEDLLTGYQPLENNLLCYNMDTNSQGLNVVNATDTLEYDRQYILEYDRQYTLSASLPSSSYISLSRTEEQGEDDQWCAAYSTAAIIRTVKNVSLYASTIADYFNLSTSQVLSNSQAIYYAQAMYQMNPIFYEIPLSFTEVQDEIYHDRPIYAQMRHTFFVAHVVVIRGYNSSTYSIWNPWYQNSYETFSVDTLTYIPSTDTRDFSWCDGIKNWQ